MPTTESRFPRVMKSSMKAMPVTISAFSMGIFTMLMQIFCRRFFM
jgi:hypothetical protein